MRSATLIVAITAWAGLAVQLHASVEATGSLFSALWMMLLYFTVLTNIVVALLFAALAGGWRASPRLVGGVTLAIMLVGAIYHSLLSGLLDLSGGAALADVLLHTLTPIFVLLWWIVFAPKGGLTWRDPLVWALFPLAYLGYGLARGAQGGRYPYPFMNVSALGWTQTLLNAAAIAIGFVVAGYMLCAIDRRLSRSRSR
ncbi:Pr6Pr family membrane protein [Novosphingobium rosa]|uniref:Pr6Pr family membrane protein n=1 Tax=Novosphingobium rosa TaxID=76978 RepID=UPI0012EDA0E9|nr:Pr6Pr family membrane protein [Novosphingobium rosa]